MEEAERTEYRGIASEIKQRGRQGKGKIQNRKRNKGIGQRETGNRVKGQADKVMEKAEKRQKLEE